MYYFSRARFHLPGWPQAMSGLSVLISGPITPFCINGFACPARFLATTPAVRMPQ
jgi:hypothetical protein